MRPGVRLGVDVGEVRIGVASSDPAGLVATPVETVPAGPGALDRLRALALELGATEAVVGLPRSLSGREGPAAGKARSFAQRLADRLARDGVGVRLCDERLSTVTAEAALRAQGRKGRRRRAVVDQAAAVVILQTALDTERGSGRPPGEPVPAKRPQDHEGAAVAQDAAPDAPQGRAGADSTGAPRAGSLGTPGGASGGASLGESRGGPRGGSWGGAQAPGEEEA